MSNFLTKYNCNRRTLEEKLKIIKVLDKMEKKDNVEVYEFYSQHTYKIGMQLEHMLQKVQMLLKGSKSKDMGTLI
jgi:hypothetical protein